MFSLSAQNDVSTKKHNQPEIETIEEMKLEQEKNLPWCYSAASRNRGRSTDDGDSRTNEVSMCREDVALATDPANGALPHLEPTCSG